MENAVTRQDLLVSVVVATYKRDSELKNALNSLANQTYRNIEVILIDDNANAQWNEKVNSVVKEVRSTATLNINYIVNEHNCGSAATRNKGIMAANGEYITFLDDDDLYLPEKIEMQINDMLASQADFGLTDLYLYNNQDQVTDKRVRSYIERTDPDSLMRYHLLHHMTGTDTLMFKSEYLRSIGGFPGIDIGDEFYLMKEAILGGGKCVYSNHCYVKAYVHTGENGGLSSGQGKIDGENALFEEKKKYFQYLHRSDIRYVKMRHYAVLAFAELRRKGLGRFVGYAVKAFFSAPIGFLRLFFSSL